jgi:hypothetical protein
MALKRKRLQQKMEGRDPTTELVPEAGANQNPNQDDEKKYVVLVTGTVEDHKMKFHENDDFIYPQKLYDFWVSIPEKEKQEKGLQCDTKIAREVFQNFYDSRIHHVSNHFKNAKGVETNDHKALYRHFKNGVPAREKEEISMFFYSDQNGMALFKMFCQKQEFMKKQEMERFRSELKRQQEKKSKTQNDSDKNKSISKKKIIQKLSQPKDRLKIGKTLLQLKSHYPHDKILRDMIKEEFKNERVAKRPLEYDNFDSDEEELMKDKREMVKFRKNSEGKREIILGWEDKEREQELLTRFKEICKKYNKEKKDQMKEERNIAKRIKSENDKIEDYILKKVTEWRKLTMNKMNEKIPTETEFLSSTYQEMKNLHPEATKRLYNHSTAGENKELAKKSYPLTFKHEFFKVFRTLNKKELKVATKNKVGFWAPGGEKDKSSHNQKIIQNSKETKFKEIWDTRDKEGAWEEENFQKER